jgi:hypothetical protein
MSKPIDMLGLGPARAEVPNSDGSWVVVVTPGALMPANMRIPKSVRLTPDQYRRYRTWLDAGVLIQNALPELTPADREVLLTGL